MPKSFQQALQEATTVLERFEALVPVDNPSGREADIRQVISETLKTIGVTDQTVDAAGNLFVRLAGNPAKDVIMLSAHMDSVPPCEGIEPMRDKDATTGRPVIRSAGKTILGADDKSGIAVILEIATRIQQSGKSDHHPLEFLFSVEEEVGLNGAKGFDRSQSKAKYCYVLDGEGRVGTIFNAGPSQENLQLICHGKASHAGISPESGISAVVMAAALVSELPVGRLAADCTTNLGVVDGGKAMNITPPDVLIKGEARSHDEQKLTDVLNTYEKTAAAIEQQFPGSQIEFIHVRRYDHFLVDPSHISIQRATEVANQLKLNPVLLPMNIGSDAHILNQRDLPTVVLGMGFHFSHSLGEFLFCEEYEQVAEWVWELVK